MWTQSAVTGSSCWGGVGRDVGKPEKGDHLGGWGSVLVTSYKAGY